MDATPAVGSMHEPQEPQGHSVPTPHHAVNYFLIFYTLIALTVVTVGIAFHRFHNEVVNICLALLVACIKATFVARYFMHLKFEGKLIWLILVAPLTLCIIMIAALVPDIALGRHVALNDVIGWFEEMGR